MSEKQTMLDWALRYAALGWKVFPLSTGNDKKRPAGFLGKSDDKAKTGGQHAASSNPATIRKWWTQSPKSGIAVNLVASGLCAADVDPKDDGPAKLARLESQFGKLKTPVVQITGSDGFHYLYGAEPGLSMPGKLMGMKGLDLKYNGYIVLAPSPHSASPSPGAPPAPTGKFYRWKKGADPFENADFLPAVPEWFLQRPDGSTAVARVSEDPADVFAADAQKCGLSAEQIVSLLDLVPNDDSGEAIDYDSWFNVLAGIWHETEGSAEGKAIALAWSQQSPRHDPEKFRRTWPSLDHRESGRAPITLRFLIKLANAAKSAQAAQAAIDLLALVKSATSLPELRAACREVKITELDTLDRNNLRAEVQKRHKEVTGNSLTIGDARSMCRYEDPEANNIPPWLEPWVYLGAEEVFLKKGTPLAITKPGFDNLYNVHMLSRQEILEGIGYPELTASNAALNRFQIERVDRRIYLPGADQVFEMGGVSFFNSYSNAMTPPIPDKLTRKDREAIATVEAHFAHMAPNERERGIFLSWLSSILKLKRPNWSVVHQSLEGEGKSFMSVMMGAVAGATNVQILDPKILQGKFTGWAEGGILKIVEEIKLHGSERYEVLDSIKTFITNPVIGVHPKNKEAVNVPNTAAYLMFTNHRDALPIVAGDTRYFLLASPRQTPEAVKAFSDANPGYYHDLFGALDDSPGAIRKWLIEYPVHPEFSATARAPRSDEKDYVVALGKSDSHGAIEDLITEATDKALSCRLFDSTMAADMDDAFPRTRSVEVVLARMGFTFLGRFKIDGRKRRFWSQFPKEFGQTGTAQVAAQIRAYLENDLWNRVADL